MTMTLNWYFIMMIIRSMRYLWECCSCWLYYDDYQDDETVFLPTHYKYKDGRHHIQGDFPRLDLGKHTGAWGGAPKATKGIFWGGEGEVHDKTLNIIWACMCKHSMSRKMCTKMSSEWWVYPKICVNYGKTSTAKNSAWLYKLNFNIESLPLFPTAFQF